MVKKRQSDAATTDLAALSALSDNDLCACLKDRYVQRERYTWVGSKQLVVMKLHGTSFEGDEQTGLDYVTAYKDTTSYRHEAKPVARPPHIFELVDRAYFHMRRTGDNQSVILCGNTGAGKTYARNQVTQQLVRLNCSHKRDGKISVQLLNAQAVLDVFGSAATPHNSSASRFGYYTEIHYNERGRMTGAKMTYHLFDKMRLAMPNESTFSVFYRLMADTSPEERDALHLHQGHEFRYLATARRTTWVDPTTMSVMSGNKLTSLLKHAGFRGEHISRIMQLLAAILHLGELSFLNSSNRQDAAYVKEVDKLNLVADFLGVEPRALENVLVFKTTMIRKDLTTLILDADQAGMQRDELARTLYSLLFAWVVKTVNAKLCANQEPFSSISVVDFPGRQEQAPDSSSDFYSFLVNVANDRVQEFTLKLRTFHNTSEDSHLFEHVTPPASMDALADLMLRPSRGVCSVIDSMTETKRDTTDADMVDSLIKYNGRHEFFSVNSAPGSQQRRFAIQHFGDKSTHVVYDPTGFLESNKNHITVDFVSLFLGGAGMQSSWNAFLVELWQNDIDVQTHSKNADALVSARQRPSRMPSTHQKNSRRSSSRSDDHSQRNQGHTRPATTLGELNTAMDQLVGSLREACVWTLYCIQPSNNQQARDTFDTPYVTSQIKAYNMTYVARASARQHFISYTDQEFLLRYARLIPTEDDGAVDGQERLEAIAQSFGWTPLDATVGNLRIYLSFDSWRTLEDQLRALEKSERGAVRDPGISDQREEPAAPPRSDDCATVHTAQHLYPATTAQQFYGEQRSSFYSGEGRVFPSSSSNSQAHDNSVYGSSENYTHDMLLQDPRHKEPDSNLDETDEDESKQSATRRRWLLFVSVCTWWIPSKLLIWWGGMKRKDVRIAWREKVTLCMLIAFMCGAIIWFLVFFGEMVCPYQAVFSESELKNHGGENKAYIAIRGEVFDLTGFAPHHYPDNIVPMESVLEYGGKDITDLFPVQVSALCQGITGEVSPFVSLSYQVNLTDDNAHYHDFRYSSGMYRPDWYYQQMTMLRKSYKVGHLGYEPKAVSDEATSETTVTGGIETTRKWAYIDNHIYDLTMYGMGGRRAAGPPGQQPPAGIDLNFMDPAVLELFRQKSGGDITQDWANLALDAAVKQRQLVCLRNLFFVGMLDTRNSAKCQFSTYLLLIVTCFICAVIVFKFLAAFRVGSSRIPEELDKFVITQVTCYTEDDESIRKTVDSLATLQYDDKRKLLFIICDGMIVGSGNDKPTPRIVLDILGVGQHVDAEPLSFYSVGEGQKQHNMGKIYSGLYETAGHVVPYLVVVKCGKPTERQKPGNRGKRDSQLILMEFLNCVHFDAPMSPLQLEIYHQMKNVIGVSPHLYEYVLMVDADTEVLPDSLSFLVSSMAHDSKVIGVCGETELNNPNASWISMIQVYEYFISHHMIKAFESLFSTVTCLPGCFTMYRIRSVDGRRALFCSNEIIKDYHVNKVDTLHMKNLLYLGEDRYLTTLLLKHFPSYKTKFVSHAQCRTNAPDMWSVLVSQRRRWINSTIHNLGELMFLPRLCGFCCFSMRFVVLMDLVSTLVMPAMVGYLGFLIYKLSTMKDTVPILTIIVLAGTYGLQAVLFILRRRWEYVLWMLLSILATPCFWFLIPINAYWHFDDFSWGNTRVVVGEKGQMKKVVADEGEFDPRSIPKMTWSQYEKMLLADDYGSDGGISYGSSSRSSHTTHRRPAATVNSSGGNPSIAYTPTLAMYYPPSSTGFYTGTTPSAMIPSSASVPIMSVPYTSAFSMQPPTHASAASYYTPQEQYQYQHPQQQPQFIPMQQFPSPTLAPSATAAGDHSSSQSVGSDGLRRASEPTNDEILAEIKRILTTSDLTKVTKKQVREDLEHGFGVSMAHRRDYINFCIEGILQGSI